MKSLEKPNKIFALHLFIHKLYLISNCLRFNIQYIQYLYNIHNTLVDHKYIIIMNVLI